MRVARRWSVVVTALMLAGCGSGTQSGAAGDVVVRFLGRAHAARTVAFTESIVAALPHEPRVTIERTGAIDFGTNVRWYRVTFGTAGSSRPVLTSTILTDGTATYGSAALYRLRGYDWIKLPPGAPGGPSTPGNVAPFDVLDNLPATESVVRVGRETINGIATTEYRVTWQRDAYARRYNVKPQTVAAADLVAEIWVDRAGRLRQLAESHSIYKERYNFDRYGAPVNVTIPTGPGVYDAADDTSLVQADYTNVGPWTVVGHGHLGAHAYTLTRAAAGPAWSCWTVQIRPPFDNLGVIDSIRLYSTFDGPAPTQPPSSHDGLPVECKANPSLGRLSAPIVLFPSGFSESTAGGQTYLGIAVAGIDHATVTFTDHAKANVAIDPHTHVLAWSGPSQPFVQSITAPLPNGHRAVCGDPPSANEPVPPPLIDCANQ
jgi:hypothetical protein